MAELARREGVPADRTFLHAITDGRDTAPRSAETFIAELEAALRGRATIATVAGRFYAMDRDRRWERTAAAWDAIVHGRGRRAATAPAAVREAYDRGESDEFIEPTVVHADGAIRDGDAVVHLNFRADRARQLTRALALDDFDAFDRGDAPEVRLTTLTEYDDDFDFPIGFPPARPDTTLAAVLADAGVEQLHVAETEKYAHVTYFFNGGREDEWAGETRVLVPSPRDVPSYDFKPEMSAREVAARFCGEVGDGYRFGVVNFANPDMVGHTGSIPAVIKAVETVDGCLGKVVETVDNLAGACLVTADHGNAEQMLESDGVSPHTAHTTNPVPLIVTNATFELRSNGELKDLIPTALDLLGLDKPAEMTGESLVRKE
jgi:2,3-bisphosphoglycerate-independent phosphoglycerate mutase